MTLPPGSPDHRPGDGSPWDRALGYALTGVDHRGWVDTEGPDVDRLIARLTSEGIDPAAVRRHRADRRLQREPWPHVVPLGLRAGLGAAQFAAALGELVGRLGPDRTRMPVLSDRRPDPDELRLLRDVPPHHGV